MNHLLALLGITLLCAAWVTFQLWLKRVDPSKGDFRPGCGACGSGSCGTESGGGCGSDKTNKTTTVSLVQTGLGGSSKESE